MQQNKTYRIEAIDIMRGLTLILMLFVNDLYESGVPHWMVHAKADEDAMGLADWVFPGFLFMVGLAIPFAMAAREKKGEKKHQLFWHILLRSASLLLIGVLIYNGSERLNGELTGINSLGWLLILYVCVFLIWNQYPVKSSYSRLFLVLKLLGVLGLVWLCWIFKAGKPGDTSWLRPGWWGILGLIGWGYLVAASGYFFAGKKITYIILLWLLFVILNICSDSIGIGVLDRLNPALGVVTDGNVPSIVLAGLIVGVALHRHLFKPRQFTWILLVAALASIGTGLMLRHWFIISKIIGTPSWAMLCNGISMALFALIYALTEIGGHYRWAGLFRMAGRNSLSTYLAPDMIYFICWYFNWQLFSYKQDQYVWLAITGSMLWAVLMVLYARQLSKWHIRLKL